MCHRELAELMLEQGVDAPETDDELPDRDPIAVEARTRAAFHPPAAAGRRPSHRVGSRQNGRISAGLKGQADRVRIFKKNKLKMSPALIVGRSGALP
jgi:hypothetical protein